MMDTQSSRTDPDKKLTHDQWAFINDVREFILSKLDDESKTACQEIEVRQAAAIVES